LDTVLVVGAAIGLVEDRKARHTVESSTLEHLLLVHTKVEVPTVGNETL
jgi:hypothetical protein